MSKSLIEQFARRNAKRTTRNGVEVLVTDGDPLLLDAFKDLGWEDPHEDEPAKAPATPRSPTPPAAEVAAVTSPERAVVATVKPRVLSDSKPKAKAKGRK